MQVETRLGTQGDVPALVELYRRFRESLVSERGGARYLAKEAFAEPLDAHFEAIVADDQRLVLLGTLDDVPVGTAVARLKELPDSSHLAIVEVLYVDPPAREVGVGEKLLEAVVDWAGQGDATGLDVSVLPGAREAKNFLEGAGFVARLLVMHRRLS
jgi:GNAT superfamily N-acetyltransferase